MALPSGTVRRVLQDLTALEMVMRFSRDNEESSDGRADQWEMADDTRTTWDEFDPEFEAAVVSS